MSIDSRLAEVLTWPLLKGSHKSIAQGACVMEAVAYVAGEPWSDSPACVCPVIAEFMRSWNDALDDETRTRLLRPLIPEIIGTRSTAAVKKRRGYLALDWVIRVHTPKLFDLVPALQKQASELRALDEIADMAGATAAGKIVHTAWDAAWDAAGAAARDAAGAAARAAARDAAWAAARAAARDALKPTTEWLQQSALDLVRRMIAVQP